LKYPLQITISENKTNFQKIKNKGEQMKLKNPERTLSNFFLNPVRNKRIEKVAMFANSYMNEFTDKAYHNFDHALTVARDVSMLARIARGSFFDRFNRDPRFFYVTDMPKKHEELLIVSALLHDIHSSNNAAQKDRGEIYSAKISEFFLPTVGYSVSFSKKVGELILDTKFGVKPSCYLGELLQDADMASLGKKEFWAESERVRDEMQRSNKKLFTELEYYESRINLLKNYVWKTDVGKKAFYEGTQKNLVIAKERLEVYRNSLPDNKH